MPKFKFKNHEDYQNQRAELLNQAEEALQSGDTEQFNNLTADVTAMDNDWEEYRVNKANLEALQKEQKPMVNLIGFGGNITPTVTDVHNTV